MISAAATVVAGARRRRRLPLGIAAGRWAWTAFATSIDVVPVTVVPLVGLVLGLLALVIAGNALTALPAVRASHAPTAAVLRGE